MRGQHDPGNPRGLARDAAQDVDSGRARPKIKVADDDVWVKSCQSLRLRLPRWPRTGRRSREIQQRAPSVVRTNASSSTTRTLTWRPCADGSPSSGAAASSPTRHGERGVHTNRRPADCGRRAFGVNCSRLVRVRVLLAVDEAADVARAECPERLLALEWVEVGDRWAWRSARQSQCPSSLLG